MAKSRCPVCSSIAPSILRAAADITAAQQPAAGHPHTDLIVDVLERLADDLEQGAGPG
jgi:hypothetical protein